MSILNCETELMFDTVVIDGVAIPISKNPKYKRGRPVAETHASHVGSTTTVTKKMNYKDAFSTLTIYVRPTKTIMEQIEQAQDALCGVSIMILDFTGETKTFSNMSIGEDIEWDLDGEEQEITFQGSSAI